MTSWRSSSSPTPYERTSRPVEQARSWRRLMDAKGLMSQRELAETSSVTTTPPSRGRSACSTCRSRSRTRWTRARSDPQTGYELSRIEPTRRSRHSARGGSQGGPTQEGRPSRQRVKESKLGRGRPGRRRRAGGRVGARPSSPTERTVKLDGGFKVVVSGRKGFDEATWVEVLRAALGRAAARIEPAGRGGDPDAA